MKKRIALLLFQTTNATTNLPATELYARHFDDLEAYARVEPLFVPNPVRF
jgi:hypothetical protein